MRRSRRIFRRWLAPWLEGVTRREHLARIPLAAALRALLDHRQLRELEEWAPAYLTMPTGSRIRVDYADPSGAGGGGAAAGSVRTGRLPAPRARQHRGDLPLLSPAQRPLQVTRDLASFWRGAYAQVRKDMRGRYPKHYWPEDPLEAQPVRGARRRS